MFLMKKKVSKTFKIIILIVFIVLVTITFVYDLNYEKFINNPETESKKLMEYCNLPWDKRCLEFYKRKDIVSDTASDVQIRKAVHKYSLDKYLPYKPFVLKHGEGKNNAIINKL